MIKPLESGLGGVRWIDLPSAEDERGILTSIEESHDIPFKIRRVFYMHHINEDRGGHAHLNTEQLVIGIAGSHIIEVMDKSSKKEYVLSDPKRGLFLPRMTFTRLLNFSAGAVSLVLASTHYERTKSVRTFSEYKALLL